MGKIYMKDNVENPLLFICFRQFISIVFVDLFCLLQCLVFASIFFKEFDIWVNSKTQFIYQQFHI